MIPVRLRRATAAAATIALVLVACGDDEPADRDGAPDAAEQTQEQEAVDGTGGTDGDVQAEFEELLDIAGESAARVTYEVTTDGDTATATVSIDPPRIATIFDGGRVIDDGDGQTVICGEEEASSECFILGEDDGNFGALMSSWLLWPFFSVAQAMAAGGDIEGFATTGTEEIAGREATCATFDGGVLDEEQAGVTAEYCLDSETGIGLRYVGSSPEAEEVTMLATEYDAPRPDDFVPPAEPQPMPELE
jgi:hypothetical protein